MNTPGIQETKDLQGRVSKYCWTALKYLSIAWVVYGMIAVYVGWTNYRTYPILPLSVAVALRLRRPAGYVFLLSTAIAQIPVYVYVGLEKYQFNITKLVELFNFMMAYIVVYSFEALKNFDLQYFFALIWHFLKGISFISVPVCAVIVAFLLIQFRRFYLQDSILPRVTISAMISFAALLISIVPILEKKLDPSWNSRDLQRNVFIKDDSGILIKGKYILRHDSRHIGLISLRPDSKHIAASTPGYVVIWDMVTGAFLRTLPKKSGRGITKLHYSPDGRHLVVAGSKSIDILDAETGDIVTSNSFENKFTHEQISISPNGQWLALIDTDKVDKGIYLYNIYSGRKRKISTPEGLTNSIVFSPDGKHIAYCDTRFHGLYSVIDVFKISSGERVNLIGRDDKIIKEIKSVVFTPDGKQIISVSADKVIRIHEIYTGRLIKTYTGHGSELLTTTPDGNYIASSDGYKVKILDVQNGKDVAEIGAGDITDENRLHMLVYSADGKYMAACGGGAVILWEVVQKP